MYVLKTGKCSRDRQTTSFQLKIKYSHNIFDNNISMMNYDTGPRITIIL